MTRQEAKRKAEELVGKMTVEEKASQLRFDAPAIERLGVPEYNWWNEALHGLARGGTATSFPQAIGMAAMFDDELLQKIADAVATEARAKYNAVSKEGDRDIYHGLPISTSSVILAGDAAMKHTVRTLISPPASARHSYTACRATENL